ARDRPRARAALAWTIFRGRSAIPAADRIRRGRWAEAFVFKNIYRGAAACCRACRATRTFSRRVRAQRTLRCAALAIADEWSTRCLLVGIDELAGLLVAGREHGLIAHAAPRIEVGAFGNVVILDLHHPGFGPFAVFAELDLGIHDRADGMRAQVVGDLIVIEALGSFDRLLQHLQIGVTPAA